MPKTLDGYKEMEKSHPNIVSRGLYGIAWIFSKIGCGVQAVSDVYYVTVSVIVKSPPQGTVPAVPESHTMYLKVAEDGSPDFIHELSQATPVKFLRGATIVKALNQQFKTNSSEDKQYTPSAALLSISDAQFIQSIHGTS